MTDRKPIRLEAKVVLDPEYNISKKGNPFLKFAIRDKQGINSYSCLAYGEVAEQWKSTLEAGDLYFISGMLDEKDGDTIHVKSIGKSKETIALRSLDVRAAGGEVKYRAERATVAAQRTRDGRVAVYWGSANDHNRAYHRTSVEDKERCIKTKDGWEMKLHYCQRILGDSMVWGEMQKALKIKDQTVFSLHGAVGHEDYKDWLEVLVGAARTADPEYKPEQIDWSKI